MTIIVFPVQTVGYVDFVAGIFNKGFDCVGIIEVGSCGSSLLAVIF